jgi:O-antigen ligase
MRNFNLQYNNVLSSVFGFLLFLLCVFPNKISTGTITIPNLIPVGILLLAVVVLYGYFRKSIRFNFNKISILFILLYFCYVIGVVFSEFPDIGKKYLEYKLSLIVFPFLLMIRTKGIISYRNMFIGLILGCITGAFIGLYKGFNCYVGTKEFSCWLSSSVSTIVHPTYFSVYTTIAIIAIWIGYYRQYRFFSLLPSIIVTFFLVVYTLFMMSLTGMLFLALMIFTTIAVLVYLRWKKIGVVAFIVTTPLLLFACYKAVPQFKHEIDDVIYYGERYLDNSENYFESLYYPYSGTESRLIMWKISIEQFKDTPWGLGTGAVDFALQKRMENRLNEEFIQKNLNSHNQYLQTGLEIGFLGLFVLLLVVLLLTIKSIREKNLLLFAVVLSFAFNCLFESMLQRQSGVVFYILMFCILTIPYSLKKDDEL